LSLKIKVNGLSVIWPQNHSGSFSSVWALKPMTTVCEWFGLKTTRAVSIDLTSKPVTMVFTSLTSKPVATISSGLASKPAATIFSGLASKSVMTVFSSLPSKLVATVSLDLASKPAVGFLVEPQNQGGGGSPDLGLKTGSSGLVIWVSTSPWPFHGLSLKTKQTSVCLLRHKTNRGRSARDMRRDLATCFTWK
jgi:hypothetical protein